MDKPLDYFMYLVNVLFLLKKLGLKAEPNINSTVEQMRLTNAILLQQTNIINKSLANSKIYKSLKDNKV